MRDKYVTEIILNAERHISTKNHQNIHFMGVLFNPLWISNYSDWEEGNSGLTEYYSEGSRKYHFSIGTF